MKSHWSVGNKSDMAASSKMELHMFVGVRKRGGLDGCKWSTSEPFGVDWEKLVELRNSFEEKIKQGIQSALEKSQSQNILRLSRDSSILTKPNKKPSSRRPSVQIVKLTRLSNNNVQSESLVQTVLDEKEIPVIEEVTTVDGGEKNLSPCKESDDHVVSPLLEETNTNVIVHQEIDTAPSDVIPYQEEVIHEDMELTETEEMTKIVANSETCEEFLATTAESEDKSTKSPLHSDVTVLLTEQMNIDEEINIPSSLSNNNIQTLTEVSDSPMFVTPPSSPLLNCTYVISTANEEVESRKHPRPPSAELNTDMPSSKKVIATTVFDVPSSNICSLNSFLPRNSPVKAYETQELRKQLLKAKINEKAEKEEMRKKELEAKKERERLDRIRKREEKAKKVAENKAALLKKANEKKRKVDEKDEAKPTRNNAIDRGEKLKQRHLAAEQRRKEKEREKELKFQTLENERRLLEELQKKRQEMKETERLMKKAKTTEAKTTESKREPYLSPTCSVVITKLSTGILSGTVSPNDIVSTNSTVSTNGTVPTNDTVSTNSTVSINGTVPTNDTVSINGTVPTNGMDTVSPVSISSTTGITTNDTTSTTESTTVQPIALQQTKNTPVSKKYTNITSYQITPASQDPLKVADDYGINELQSSDSSDDEDCPKKAVPMWAVPQNINKTVAEQEYRLLRDKDFDVDKLFPPEELLVMPDLDRIFRHHKKKRFYKRTSSAQWNSPILKKNNL